MTLMENIKNSPAVRVYRQGWLAWLGAHKAAFDLAQENGRKLMTGREQLVEELVGKGEEVEGLAKDNFEKARSFVEPRLNEVSERVSKVRGKVFTRTAEVATDPVQELSTELAKLTKTVDGLNRKVNAFTKPAAKKAPAKKATAKKTAAKPAAKAAPKKAATPAEAKPATAPETKSAA